MVTNMPLLLTKGGYPYSRIDSANGIITFQRDSLGWGESIFVLLMLAILTVVLLGMLVVLICVWLVIIRTFAVGLLFFGVVLGMAWVPAVFGWFIVQGLLFPFRAILGNGKYQLANGALRVTRTFKPEESQVLIYAIYRHGDWGYGAKLKRKGKLWSLPLMPPGILGAKLQALNEAREVRDWLEKTSAVKVTMLGWNSVS